MVRILDNPEIAQISLDYHSGAAFGGHPLMDSPGKVAIYTTKACTTQSHLATAYTPLVGAIVETFSDDPATLALYSGYGNRGAVVTDGSAILGYGDLGPRAATPVMEGKSLLFKVFADVNMDAIMIERHSVDEIVEFCMALQPTYAGINLEDIAAPKCFEIEERLQKDYTGFIFHDDQHGTAVITMAGLWNALEILELDIGKVSMVMMGAGASALACCKLFRLAGMKDIIILDSNGVVYNDRPHRTNKYKDEFSRDLSELGLKPDAQGRIGIGEAIKGRHLFVGLSVGDLLNREMVATMAEKSIIVAMANPFPEITPDEAYAGKAKIVCTGRSDYPNQVNNSLGFPGIFRGALDSLIGRTTDDVKIAAAEAIRRVAHMPVPQELQDKYPKDKAEGVFTGENPLKSKYVVPLGLDTRVPVEVAAAVYKCAMDTGIARAKLPEGYSSVDEYLPVYRKGVEDRIKQQEVLRTLITEQWKG